MKRIAVEPLEGRTLFASYNAAKVSELIASINAANQSPESDTITLDAGTQAFRLPAPDHDDTGLPLIAAGGGGLTIIGDGNSIMRSDLPGTPAFRIFDVAAGASL